MKKSRKLLLGLACLSILITLSSLVATAATFVDIKSTDWFYQEVQYLNNKGIIAGKGGNRFSPGDLISRAEFAIMVCKTELSASELSKYKKDSIFKDVPKDAWYNAAVNWALEKKVFAGINTTQFMPNRSISRQEIAKVLNNYAKLKNKTMPKKLPMVSFNDQSSIGGWAQSSVQACQQAGIMNGDKNLVRPLAIATRSEAASMFARYLQLFDPKPVTPTPPPVNKNYTLIDKTIAGSRVTGVEFSPKQFQALVGMANNSVNKGESMSSIIARTGAKIAVNAAFFDMRSYAPIGTIISNGETITIDNKYAPAKTSFNIDTTGNASIQNFKLNQIATLKTTSGKVETLQNVGMNRAPSNGSDATRIVFTHRWGGTLGFPARDAVVVDGNGVVTKIVTNSDVNIPERGYVICQRARREFEGDFFNSVNVGSTISLASKYEGLQISNIYMSIAAGPRIVMNGQAYGNANTYRAEGFTDPGIITSQAKRVAIGVKSNGNVVIASTFSNLSQLSSIMLNLGCSSAINLDGGASTGLYVDGKWLQKPDRLLNNILYFK